MPFLIQMVYKQHQKKLFILITIILKTQIVKYLIQVKRSGVFLKKAREILFIQNFTYHQKRINKVSVRTTILCRSIFKQILKPLLWVGEGLSISLTPRQHQKYIIKAPPPLQPIRHTTLIRLVLCRTIQSPLAVSSLATTKALLVLTPSQ